MTIPGAGGQTPPRPDQQYRGGGGAVVAPGSTQVIRALQVIVSGTGAGVGLFVYSGTPALGNPPIFWATSASTDPYGNAVAPTAGVASTGVFHAGNTLINAQGTFTYSGAPALGNLIISDAPASGTDSFGNAYTDGLTVGLNNNAQVRIRSVGGVGELDFPLNVAGFANAIMDSGVVGNHTALVINGPQSTTAGFKDFIGLLLNSSDVISSFSNLGMIYNDITGVAREYVVFDGAGLHISACAALTATDPTTGTGLGNVAQPEVWHDLRPLLNSWVGTISGQYPPQYRKLADGNIQVFGFVKAPNTGNPNGVIFANLAVSYRPTGHNMSWPVTMDQEPSATVAFTPRCEIDTAGNLQIHQAPTSFTAIPVFNISGIYPLDNTGLIQS